jgi:tRNA A37 threonylcarbamoyladenosine biosynthesis protein TsaE
MESMGLGDEKRGLFITIDANIGAGKSNACHAIASAATSSGWPARVLEEPTHHPKFNHFLQRYYEDRWRFCHADVYALPAV